MLRLSSRSVDLTLLAAICRLHLRARLVRTREDDAAVWATRRCALRERIIDMRSRGRFARSYNPDEDIDLDRTHEAIAASSGAARRCA